MEQLSGGMYRITVAGLRSVANLLFAATSIMLFGGCIFVACVGHQIIYTTGVLSGLASILAFAAIAGLGQTLPARLLVALSFSIQVMMLIFAASNLDAAYIEEAHMIYFVLNCYLLAYACWRSLVLYNAVVVAHHLVLTVVMPNLVWSADAADQGANHLAIHAFIAFILVGPLMITAEQLRRTIVSNTAALALSALAADTAQADATHANVQRNEAERRALSVQDIAGVIDIRLQALFRNTIDASQDVDRSARLVADISSTCSENTGNVDRSFERTTLKMRDVAGSAEILARSVVQMANRAKAAADTTRSAVAASTQATDRVSSLIVAGRRVGEVITIIQEVADAINMLALNATIEASRAGESGRGFAIVAQNVKALVSKTRMATEEIARHVADIQNETREAVGAIGLIGDAVKSAYDHATEIAVSTAQQKAMTALIAETASHIARDTDAVRVEVAKTLSLLISAQTMSGRLLSASGDLKRTAEISTEECDQLLARLRVAI